MSEKPTRVPVQIYIEDGPDYGRMRVVAVDDNGGNEVVLFDIDKRVLNFDPFICVAIDFEDRSKPKAEPEAGERPQPASK